MTTSNKTPSLSTVLANLQDAWHYLTLIIGDDESTFAGRGGRSEYDVSTVKGSVQVIRLARKAMRAAGLNATAPEAEMGNQKQKAVVLKAKVVEAATALGYDARSLDKAGAPVATPALVAPKAPKAKAATLAQPVVVETTLPGNVVYFAADYGLLDERSRKVGGSATIRPVRPGVERGLVFASNISGTRNGSAYGASFVAIPGVAEATTLEEAKACALAALARQAKRYAKKYAK